MKTLGLIGGMSWESTAVYYRLLNQEIRSRLGGEHSSKLLLHSVDFEPIVRLQHSEDWSALGDRMVDVAGKLEGAGCDALVLCTNTMHKLAPEIQTSVGIPLLHIADAVGEALRDDGHSVVGLLGTKFTMESTFYRERLEKRFRLKVLVPAVLGRGEVHRIIYDELCRGVVKAESQSVLREVVQALAESGATAAVLGCTELGMAMPPGSAAVPLYDTTVLHCRAAVEFQLAPATRKAGQGA